MFNIKIIFRLVLRCLLINFYRFRNSIGQNSLDPIFKKRKASLFPQSKKFYSDSHIRVVKGLLHHITLLPVISVPVAMRFLDPTSRGRTLASGFCCELLPGRLPTSGFTGSLLGTSHVPANFSSLHLSARYHPRDHYKARPTKRFAKTEKRALKAISDVKDPQNLEQLRWWQIHISGTKQRADFSDCARKGLTAV